MVSRKHPAPVAAQPVLPSSAPSDKLSESLRDAIEEQQQRVWQLRSLLDVVHEAVADNSACDDLPAALTGLIDQADAIHLALDCGAIEKRAVKLREHKEHHERIARAHEAIDAELRS